MSTLLGGVRVVLHTCRGCARIRGLSLGDIGGNLRVLTASKSLSVGAICQDRRTKHDKSTDGDKDLSALIQPTPVKLCNDPDGINVGVELTGTLKKGKLTY